MMCRCAGLHTTVVVGEHGRQRGEVAEVVERGGGGVLGLSRW
jgi:hypothetical protein